MRMVRTVLIVLSLSLVPAALTAQELPADSGSADKGIFQRVEPPRPFEVRLGAGYSRSAFNNLTDGANVMAAFVWPATSVARLRVEAFASWARWKFMGWDPGEAEIIDNIHWVTTDRETLSGASAFLELSHRAGMVRPYLYTGLSYYRGSWKDTENTDYGVAAGAGIDFDLAGWRFFAEGSLRLFGLTGKMTNDPQGVMPLTVGIRF